ncbi:hypothetical protein [Dickeya zeae]|uniref:hypothetical protein n=1 Tax=Dickeya zeae TaxID=204042 RepID=UPI00204F2388|nr:hypothetical protein [Dickeya zeae]UPT57216.1 hypothetical protein FGI00_17440 [Dickeya zeae]
MKIDPTLITGLFGVLIALIAGTLTHFVSSSKTEKDIKLSKLEEIGNDNISLLNYYHSMISTMILYYKQTPKKINIFSFQKYMDDFDKNAKKILKENIMNSTEFKNRIFIPKEAGKISSLIKEAESYKRETLRHITVEKEPGGNFIYDEDETLKLKNDATIILKKIKEMREDTIKKISKEYRKTYSVWNNIIKSFFTLLFFSMLVLCAYYFWLKIGEQKTKLSIDTEQFAQIQLSSDTSLKPVPRHAVLMRGVSGTNFRPFGAML